MSRAMEVYHVKLPKDLIGRITQAAIDRGPEVTPSKIVRDLLLKEFPPPEKTFSQTRGVEMPDEWKD